ncbi:MAG: DEAD/DEAH box helicase family protein [Ignavibacteriae bacterium]|nr:DEAD/DEAH box helicase [Ignavibacteriota bacterium]NOG96987.1 DEAD/DEAH box helicase family protein [Ignavibacteriota bacterium]
MELKEIKQICDKRIFEPINRSDRGLIYRHYESFLKWFGMYYKRNFKVLNKVDYQLKKHNITLWAGREKKNSIKDFTREDRITFKLDGKVKTNNKFTNEGKKRVRHQNAGTIKIAAQESGLKLYKHQEDAIDSLQNKIINNHKNPFEGLLVLPTGGGKTLTAAHWLAKNFLDKNKKILWIAHRHELLNQAKATFHERLAYSDIFGSKKSFNYRIISGIHDKPVNIKSTDDIIISSKDSLNSGFNYLYKNWLKGSDEIFLIVDEAHHATAKTYRKLINNLKEKVEQFKMLGLTATPYRTSKFEKGLLAKVFPDDIIYKVDLRTLISRGILSEPIFEEINTDYDITKDLTEEQLNNIKYFDISSIGKSTAKTIAKNANRNSTIVNRYKKFKSKYKQTIVFALNRDNAFALQKLFDNSGIKSEYILSDVRDEATGVTISSRENKIKIDKFRKGDFDVLISVNILTEGMDLPNVQSIFLARPTISTILMTQMIGRGLRGEKAGGTKEAFIVSFIDDWKDKVNWVNPEKLIIQEKIDFPDKDYEHKKHIIRLVAISKIQEFAILSNKTIDKATKDELERLTFIERIPLGLYHFSILNKSPNEIEVEKNCEILIYDNLKQSYLDFVNALPFFFEKHKLTEIDNLSEAELNYLSEEIDNEFFFGCVKYPGYSRQDIKDILQYFAQKDIEPKFIELKERKKYDLVKVSEEILNKNFGRKDEANYKNKLWESNVIEWKAFFGYNKKYFLNEIDLAIRKLINPDLYKRPSVVPEDEKELRKLENMSMQEIREINPQYWKWLSDSVYEKYKDEDGFYFSATKRYKSKNKLNFQIDHIVSRSNGGLTKVENLQLLTRKENARKGSN